MLGRTVAILSGMCTGLDPDFNLWDQLGPYARTLIEKEATKGVSDWLGELGSLLQNLIALPSQASRVFAQAERGDLVVQSPQVAREIRALTRSVDRLTGGIIFLGLLLGGVLLYNAGNVLYAQGMLMGAFIVLLWMLFLRRN
jgi:predicted unusual protein kinase regulating ubiquinone biosynthesis (AarF/ABC1/UbiB family)